MAGLRKQAGDARGLKLRADIDEIVLLRKQRCNTDFMATALMMNGETFYKYFCPGKSRCMDQLKNSHDLSLWTTAFWRSG